ncbi:hypothetical protein [Xanthovirga aplysinae]|uniref:hypothetical protein n=1 Tax=Xanthovirga aplysinae TaxID=2529853 RepID=UPI0012BC165C|nr:hypothetical protein [Xanthovirga aplysinae]
MNYAIWILEQEKKKLEEDLSDWEGAQTPAAREYITERLKEIKEAIRKIKD